MKNEEIRSKLQELEEDGRINNRALLFEDPAFDLSIIGTSNGLVVYDLEKMIDEFMKDNGVEYLDAMEFIYYNTIRSMSFLQKRTDYC